MAGMFRELYARAHRRHPFATNMLAMPVAVPFAVLVAAVHVIPLVVQPLGGGVRHEIRESDARKLGTALRDEEGRWIGAFPGRLDSDQRFNRGEDVKFDTDLSGRRFALHPDHKALYVEEAPGLYIACLKRLEDRNLGNAIVNPHGIDALGLLRAPTSGMRAGGSGLSSQLVQQLIRPKGQEEAWLDVGTRKLGEIFWTGPILYGHAPNDRRFDQLLARHLPHVQYTQQDRSVLWGVEASAQVLFGASADDRLPAADQFILAGATKRPIIFPMARDHRTGATTDKSGIAAKHWKTAIGRARVCADDPDVLPNAAERQQAKHDLDVRAATLPEPEADPVVDRLGRERYGNKWPERARDPFRRANIFAYSAMQGLVAEFRDALGKSWSRKVSSVTMTIDIVDERRFTPSFRTHVRRWLADRDDLNPYFRPWASYTPDEREPTEAIPEVLAVATDERGRIVMYYSSRESAPFYGSHQDENGRYQPDREDRQLASLGKLGNALVLIGDRSLSPAALTAFARSDSDAVTAATVAIDPSGSKSRRIMQNLLWTSNAAKDDRGGDLDARWSMSHGLAAASPRTILWNSLAITNALANDHRPVPAPSLIGSVTLVDLDAGRSFAPVPRLRSAYQFSGLPSHIAPAALIPPGRRADALRLFASPICGGGTLRSLSAWCRPQRARFVWAKTGTADVSGNWNKMKGDRASGVVDRLAIVGGVQFADNRRYAVFLSIGGTGPARPLTIGRTGEADAEASQLAPLFDLMLADLASRDRDGGDRGR